MKRINKTLLFLLLTFVINFTMVGLFRVFGGEYSSLSGTIMAVAYMFIPMISVLIVEKGIHKEKIQKRLMISFKINKWFFIAWLVMPALSILTFAISLLFSDVSYSPGMEGIFERLEAMVSPEKMEEMKNSIDTLPLHPYFLSIFQALIAGFTINAVAGFGEELGWRGFLVRQFQQMKFWKASVIIGFIWGVWHAPVILMGHNYPQHPQIGVAMMTVWCILLTPLFIYFTLKAGSVIAAAIAHGTLNASAGLAIMLIAGGSDLLVGLSGLSGFIALGILLLLFFVYDQFVIKEKLMTGRIATFLPPVDQEEGSKKRYELKQSGNPV